MKFLFTWICPIILSSIATLSSAYEGTSFNEVWDEVAKDSYETLIDTKVTTSSFFEYGVNLLTASAVRTVENQNDLLPDFNKLLHANGICLKGEWQMTEDSPYTGYFRKGSHGLIVARASTTLSNTKRGSYRGFGLAGKIYPTVDGDTVAKTANLFLIDNLIGTYASNYSRVELTNEPSMVPPISLSVAKLIGLGLAAVTSFSKADQNPGIRQLYPISHLAESGPFKTPTWMMVTGEDNERINSELDFRNEISRHIRENGQFTLAIYTADSETRGKKNWRKVGLMTFDEAVASWGCDHQLHFHHQKFDNNVK